MLPMTVTEDVDLAQAKKYVFKGLGFRLPEVLQELYFLAAKQGKIKTLKDAKRWLNEQEQMEAPLHFAKMWKSIQLQHGGKEICLGEWRDFGGKYLLHRRNVENWNEGDQQSRLLHLFSDAWIRQSQRRKPRGPIVTTPWR